MVAKYIPENIVISDATVLINFLETDSFPLLLKLFKDKLHITDIVLGEVFRKKSVLNKAIKNKEIFLHKTSIDMIAHLGKSFPGLDEGEASCLILAKEKSWKIATDDGAAKNYIKKELNDLYIITTFNILVECINRGYINKSEAKNLIREMESKANFTYNQEDYKDFMNQI